VQLTASVAYSNRNVTWTSSNSDVATVSTAGLVTAVLPGTAVITASAVANPAAKDAILIQVIHTTALPLVLVTSITSGGSHDPVNRSNVVGLIDITIHAFVPRPLLIERVETLIDGKVVCSQSVPGGPAV
jgi:hypothetical protein